ncbi:MAG TPA: tetratricopeptide repeat protein [Terriglobia bacterium]|nr:tetratricopeptide repeat protein [Terriglobia bacterium]
MTLKIVKILKRAPLWLAAAFLFAAASAAYAQQPLPHPVNVEEFEAQGLKLVQQGRVQEAIETFTQGVLIDPRNPSLLNALGASYSLLGEEEKAQPYFQKALDANPAFLPARKNLAISYYKSGNYASAETELQKLTASPAAQPLADMFLGLIAETNKQYQKAIDLLDSAGPLTLEEPESIVALAQSYYALGELPQARASLDKLPETSSLPAMIRFHAGLLNCQLGQYQQAARQFARAKQANPELAGIEYYQAFALAKENDLTSARQALDELKAHPHATFLNDLTTFARRSGNYEVALQAIRNAGELDPKNEQNYLDFSTLCMDSESYVVGLQIVNAGLSRAGPSYRLLVQKGALLDKLTADDKAQAAFRAAMSLQKENSLAILGLAITQEHARDFSAAAETLEAGIRQFPANAQMRYFQGVAYARMAETHNMNPRLMAQAKSALNQAIQINSSLGDPYCELAKLSSIANPSTSIRFFQECLSRKPHDYLAEYQLGRLYLQAKDSAQSKKYLNLAARERQAEKLAEEQQPHVDATGSAFGNLDASIQKEIP